MICFLRRLLISTLCAMLGTASLGSLSLAQPIGADGDNFVYRVMRNDTLIELSQRYTGTPNNWPTLRSLNQVRDPRALPIGLELHIPFSLIPMVPAPAQVIHISGQAKRNNSTLQLNERVHEGDTLATGSASFVTIELADDSLAAVPANSELHIQRLRSFQGTGLIDAIFDLEQGSVESSVAPDGRGTGRYEIRSPISITGVRGTQLRVHRDERGARTEVLSGVARMANEQGQSAHLAAQQGAGVNPLGGMIPARPLLAAPTLMPTDDKTQKNVLDFTPVNGAVAYLVRVSADEHGTRPVSSQTIDAPPARYSAPGAGTWYVLVRAIDDEGLMSADAVHAFDGRAILQTAFGLPVQNSQGMPITLNDY